MNRCYECESVITLVCQNCNTRPTPARCDELETVGWLWEYAQYRTDDRGYYGYETVITESNPTDHVSPAEKLRNVRELVTRQNAEEVIAAKDEIIDRHREAQLALGKQLNMVIADNASLIHDLNRIKDHETELINDNAAKDARIAKMEADNKRLREALLMSEAAISEFYRYQYGGEMHGSYDGKPERDGLWKAMYKARAALGEVKS